MSSNDFATPPIPPQPPGATPPAAAPAIAATPAGQQIQGFGNRAWRAFGTTPWWRLVAGGLIVILATLLLAVPFDSIRLANKIRSQAAKDALRASLHQEVLERARGGLLLARGLAVGDEQVGEIDSALAEIDRELARPIAVERFDGSFNELKQKIETQTAKRDTLIRALQDSADRLAKAKGAATQQISKKISELSEELDSLNELIANLEEQRVEKEAARAEAEARRAELEAERAAIKQERDGAKQTPTPPQPPAPAQPPAMPKPALLLNAVPPKTPSTSQPGTSITSPVETTDGAETTSKIQINVLGKPVYASSFSSREPIALGFQAGEPTATQIRETINRDVRKGIGAGIATAVLAICFLFMLVARSFAGRAARGEQRAVIAESRERVESHARQLAEARLTLMRAQVEPHFLFNTLAHVQALQEIDPPQASTMLDRLIGYLRAAMPSMRETKSTLGREIEVVKAYLDLLKIRMGDRLKYFINVPVELNGLSLPPTMIATLVENAIKHGLEPKKEGGSIAINVRKIEATDTQPERLEVLVADDGLGFGVADTSGTGVGLANTRERLKMLYGRHAEFVVEPNAPTGVRAIIRVPLSMPESADESHVDTAYSAPSGNASPFTIQLVILLAVCFGWLGVHRFYVGRLRSAAVQAGLGVLSVLTGGLPIFVMPLFLWIVLDVVWVATREFRDSDQRRIVHLRTEHSLSSLAQGSSGSSAYVSPFTIQMVALLALFFGWIGVHRIYVGRYRTGALQAGLFVISFITGGLPIFVLPLLMWVVLDLAWIMSRDFLDASGRRVMRRDSKDTTKYGAHHTTDRRIDPSVSQSSRGVALLLAIPLGWCGAHRFYTGRIGTAFAMLFTLGGLGIWWVVDIVMVATGQLKDGEGKWVSEWE